MKNGNCCYDPSFEKKVRKIKDQRLKLKVKKEILKIIDSQENPIFGRIYLEYRNVYTFLYIQKLVNL
ncbi:hypothetical protein B6U67_06010 [Methanosarcinales archaeon ex4484_138]|nr:MAG: hypothetical protein B6U67_06010 [Methanosarcinales archaeon ex4484_138]RLG27317.1 MAG: hypothetical protein DRN85_00580 [Methanosarcinales archaeon]